MSAIAVLALVGMLGFVIGRAQTAPPTESVGDLEATVWHMGMESEC